MANDASVTMTATVLPDEIAKAISGTITVSPADADDKWYYKLSAGNTVALELPNTTIADIHAISSTSTVNCVVAALIEDVA